MTRVGSRSETAVYRCLWLGIIFRQPFPPLCFVGSCFCVVACEHCLSFTYCLKTQNKYKKPQNKSLYLDVCLVTLFIAHFSPYTLFVRYWVTFRRLSCVSCRADQPTPSCSWVSLFDIGDILVCNSNSSFWWVGFVRRPFQIEGVRVREFRWLP